MGSGKTSVGKILAKKLAFQNADLDDLIETHQQKSIIEIFRDKGEIYFRKIESQIFREFVINQSSFVLSLGGGTPCYANNHELLQQGDIISIYLKTSVDTLIKRLKQEENKRPLILNLSDDKLKDYISKHLFERNFYYHQSKYTTTTDDKNTSQIADKIIEILLNTSSK